MNQARLWLVVKPGVGIPLLLFSVAATSLIIHAAVLTHTTWYPAFYQGNQHVKQAAVNTTAPLPQGTAMGMTTGAGSVASR